MLLCASELRFGWGQGADALVRLSSECGFDGIAVGANCAQRDLANVVTLSASSGLAVPIVAAPLGEAFLPPGRRLPFLAEVDDENERLTAVKLVQSTWGVALPLGISMFTLDFGAVRLHDSPASIAFHYARRELDEDEPGVRLWASVLSERRARSQGIVDACRDALDRLLPAAERASLQMAIEVTGPWGAPTPREAEVLLDEYRGSPLSVIWNEGRTQALAAVGIGLQAARRARLTELARVLRCHQAVGIETGFAPGVGDSDGTGEWPASAPAPALVIIGGGADSRAEEVMRARAEVEARLTRPSAP